MKPLTQDENSLNLIFVCEQREEPVLPETQEKKLELAIKLQKYKREQDNSFKNPSQNLATIANSRSKELLTSDWQHQLDLASHHSSTTGWIIYKTNPLMDQFEHI